MIESIRESVVYMAHTHDGARVAMHCLWHGTAKVRTHTHTHTDTRDNTLCLMTIKLYYWPGGNFVCRQASTHRFLPLYEVWMVPWIIYQQRLSCDIYERKGIYNIHCLCNVRSYVVSNMGNHQMKAVTQVVLFTYLNTCGPSLSCTCALVVL